MVSSLFRRIEGGLGSGLYVCACAGQCTPRFDLPQMAARRGKDKPDAPVPIITDGSLAKENGPAAKIESRSGASERPGALATPGQPIFGRIAHLRNSDKFYCGRDDSGIWRRETGYDQPRRRVKGGEIIELPSKRHRRPDRWAWRISWRSDRRNPQGAGRSRRHHRQPRPALHQALRRARRINQRILQEAESSRC